VSRCLPPVHCGDSDSSASTRSPTFAQTGRARGAASPVPVPSAPGTASPCCARPPAHAPPDVKIALDQHLVPNHVNLSHSSILPRAYPRVVGWVDQFRAAFGSLSDRRHQGGAAADGRSEGVRCRGEQRPSNWQIRRPLARAMRGEPTAAEAKLWSRLRRSRSPGCASYGKRVIGRFIVDFFVRSEASWSRSTATCILTPWSETWERTRTLEALGLHVLRFRNAEVLWETEASSSAFASASLCILQTERQSRSSRALHVPPPRTRAGGQGGGVSRERPWRRESLAVLENAARDAMNGQAEETCSCATRLATRRPSGLRSSRRDRPASSAIAGLAAPFTR